jgi:transcriptional antiterminator RfaH
VIPMELEPGEEIQISGGAFHGLKAVVTQVIPARQRVAVLMDFLGRQTMVEVDVNSVVRENARKL